MSTLLLQLLFLSSSPFAIESAGINWHDTFSDSMRSAFELLDDNLDES